MYFAFNHDRPAFRGPGQIPLKQAINWAIDRPALVSAAGHRAGIPTDQILPAGLGRDESIYPLGRVTGRSLAKARQLLAKAGLKPAKLVLYANDCCAAAAEIFKFDMKQLGIDVDIRYFSTDVLLAKASRRGEPFDVVLTIWGLDYPDAVTFFEPLIDGTTIRHTGNTNVAHFDRPKYNREIQRISQLTGEARLDAWSGLDVALMRDDPPFAPVMNFNVRDLVSKSFGCYVFQPVITRVDLVAACKR